MSTQFIELLRADTQQALFVRKTSIIAIEPVNLPEHPYVRIRLISGQEYLLLDDCDKLLSALGDVDETNR